MWCCRTIAVINVCVTGDQALDRASPPELNDQAYLFQGTLLRLILHLHDEAQGYLPVGEDH